MRTIRGKWWQIRVYRRWILCCPCTQYEFHAKLIILSTHRIIICNKPLALRTHQHQKGPGAWMPRPLRLVDSLALPPLQCQAQLDLKYVVLEFLFSGLHITIALTCFIRSEERRVGT